MAQFHVLLDLENRLYDLMVENKKKSNEFLIDELLQNEHSIYCHMTREQLTKNLEYLQKVYLDQKLNQREQILFTRLARQFDFMSRFYEMQEFSSLTISEIMYLGMNPYVQKVSSDFLFYQNFYKLFHQSLEHNKIYDYLYSFLYSNYHDLKKKPLAISEEDFKSHEECSSILLEDFQSFLGLSSPHFIEVYLKLFPPSFAPYLYKKVKTKEEKDLLEKYGFVDNLSESLTLPTYVKGANYSFSQFKKYQEAIMRLHASSVHVYPFIRNAFYQVEHGTLKDIDESYLYLLKYILKEEKNIGEVLETIDDVYNFKGYIENTQLEGKNYDLFNLLTNKDSEYLLFLKRMMKKLSVEIEKNWCHYCGFTFEEEEEDYQDMELQSVNDSLWEIQEMQQIILSFLRKEISDDEFFSEINELQEEIEEDGITLEEMKNFNLLHYLTNLIWKKNFSQEKREKLVGYCCSLIYMNALERETILGNFKNIRTYHYDGKKSHSKVIKEEIETLLEEESTALVNAYQNALYLLLSKNDKRDYKRKRKLARKREL